MPSVMPSERVQRQVDGLLDQVEVAVGALEWDAVTDLAQRVLSIDPNNSDARTFLTMAGDDEAAGGTDTPAAPALAPQSDTPSSFASSRYEVRSFLGEGSKKRVFLAYDSRLDREVAFALIRTEGFCETDRERITREAQAMGRLGDHPHIVPVFDLGEEPAADGIGQTFIVSQYMAGGSVEGLLSADEPLSLERTIEIAVEVCRGLEHAHANGFVHRDLKPGNVWLADDGTAKIGDFGIAVAMNRSRLTVDGAVFPVGTVSYMPPEQAVGGDIGPQSDLYSLGVMLHEFVTGRVPFVSDDPWAVVTQHLETPPVAPSWHSEHCPPALEELILHLLQKVPEDRPQSASDVIATLERVNPEEASSSHSGMDANPLDRLARGVFVGRQAELERLRSAFDRAFSGQGNIALLVGEAGSGKTRTSQELETYARMRGARVLVGRTHESEGMPSYWPWIEVGRAYGSNNEFDALNLAADTATALGRMFPEVRRSGIEPEAATDPESAQFRLFDAYTAFIRAASERAPLMIVPTTCIGQTSPH